MLAKSRLYLSAAIHKSYALQVRCVSQHLCRPVVLGIETSCDDTGAAVVDREGNILGEDLFSQQSYSTRFGGVIPVFARTQHVLKIDAVVKNALQRSGLTLQDVDAIAVTTRPGLQVCLRVGVDYAVKLCRLSNKPLIPIHHMAAHAFVIRLLNRNTQFPFLALLLSGGHSVLTVVQSVDDFLLLGSTLDIAPGEAFDKVARRLQLCHIKPENEEMSGGKLIETYAQDGDILAFEFPYPIRRRDCNFSYSGLASAAVRYIEKHELVSGAVCFRQYVCEYEKTALPNLGCFIRENSAKMKDLCASFQHAVFRHIAKKLLRAMAYLQEKAIFSASGKKQLVVSGGVASNSYFRRGFEYVCQSNGYELLLPPPSLCTDNGVMIAWLGVEKYVAGSDILQDFPDEYPVQARYIVSAMLLLLILIQHVLEFLWASTLEMT
ncbi:O sialoglycoprotein endopeptidase [Trichuris trichiura]|uniref:N(6)-L-threonylcarbamoyladenine synthase n=1 Tax=Trichuris trichiura TaxID=36087 RepID=A0A077Z420_TRITR|nr:O sialoglycoprotein endopeptidase [Trichuris trichiura]